MAAMSETEWSYFAARRMRLPRSCSISSTRWRIASTKAAKTAPIKLSKYGLQRVVMSLNPPPIVMARVRLAPLIGGRPGDETAPSRIAEKVEVWLSQSGAASSRIYSGINAKVHTEPPVGIIDAA